MTKNIFSIGIVSFMVVCICAGAGCATLPQTDVTDTSSIKDTDHMMADDHMMVDDDDHEMMTDHSMDMHDESMMDSGMMQDDSMMKDIDDSAMMKKQPGSYIAYDAAKLAMANSGDVVLFFHAPWCPTCRAADTDITSHLSEIPSTLTILKVDYDTNVALRQQYGVTSQHTFVQVDAAGAMITKWTGGDILAALISKVQ